MTRRRLSVLQGYQDPARTGYMNPYKVQLIDSLPSDEVDARYFRWRTALLSRVDVLHLHWPEQLLRGSSRLGTYGKYALTTLLLTRVRLGRTVIVRTVHNVRPHEAASRPERWLLARFDALTSVWVIMNDTTPTPDPSRTVLIPHGHYRDWYTTDPAAQPQRGLLLTFGLLRGYKGVEPFLKAFRSMPSDASLSLVVAGRPETAATGETIAGLAADDSRIDVQLRFIDDDELTARIQRAEMIVLPYRSMHNSGSALLALSLNRPIIVPSTSATEKLVEEFGAAWVITYEGDLDEATLGAAIEAVRSRARSADGVDMSARDWSALGRRLAAVYHEAFARRREGPGASASSSPPSTGAGSLQRTAPGRSADT